MRERPGRHLALRDLLVEEGVIHDALLEIGQSEEVVILRRRTAEFLVRPHVLNVGLDQRAILPDHLNFFLLAGGDAIHHLIDARGCLLGACPG